jgi:hypothetical protein
LTPVIAPPIPAVEPPAPAAVESNTTGEPLIAAPPAVQPGVPALVLPQGQSASDISSVQVGDTLILVMKVQPVPAVTSDGTGTTEGTP